MSELTSCERNDKLNASACGSHTDCGSQSTGQDSWLYCSCGNNGGRKRLPAGGTWKGPKAGGAASGSFVEGGTLAKSRTSVPPGSVLFLAPKCIKIAIFSNNTTTTARGRNADLGLARSSVGRALSVLCSGSCLEPTSLRLYFCVILVRHGAYIRYVRLPPERVCMVPGR